MKEYVIALVDCDSFFVSCEQAVDKSLQGKPVCVLSNNDGCIVSRSKEAKKLGIKMGMPYFMAKKQFPEGIYISGNIRLYSEFSHKVMNILRDFSPNVEVYSIDEAFIEFSGLKKLHKTNYFGIAKFIRNKIKSELGINVSIGVSKSKVLAKLACEKAKNDIIPGEDLNIRAVEVCHFEGIDFPHLKINTFTPEAIQKKEGIYLIGKSKIHKILKETRVQEIWGIGRNTALLFNKWGILNCNELVAKPDAWLKSKFGRNGVELKHELLGECIDKVKSDRKLPKSIQNTRSFPKFTNEVDYIKNALNIHIHNSCIRLRRFRGKCKVVGVMLRTKDFKVYYDKITLDNWSNFELEISRTAIKLLEKIYNPELIYRSCGVTLEKLNFNEENQLSLFDGCKQKNFEKLGEAIDKLEAKFGKNIVKTGFTCAEEIEIKDKEEGLIF